MAAVRQTTIPFKSKKQRLGTTTNTKDSQTMTKPDDANVHASSRKRTNSSNTETSCQNEECVPNKIRRTQKSRASDKSSNELESEWEALPSRESEIAELREFLTEHLEDQRSGALYVSGQPGTGKTACLTHVLQLPEFKEGYKSVYINCTMVKSARSIYHKICTELKLATPAPTEKTCLAVIEKYLMKRHQMILLVLDEIDQLDSKKQSVLYTIFEWAGRPGARLVLVGVANALDLTQRALPRLQARRLRPRLLHFAPYTRDQMLNVLTKTLASGENKNLFSPVALHMLAAKVSARCGDMRLGLDTGRRVLELARRGRDASVTVELHQVLSVLNEVYGTSQRLECDVQQDSFPLQQKLLICSLVLMLTRGGSTHVTLGKLYDVYKKVARSRNIAAVELSEFPSLCGLVETRGMVRVGARGEARARRIELLWDLAEVRAALSDKLLVADILSDVACLER